MNFEKILIVGCTHGNEWTGEALIQNYANEIQESFPDLPIEFSIANPKARELNKRYIDEDLNRVFKNIDANIESHERTLAKEFLKRIKDSKTLIIDIHSSTSNLGNTLIITQEDGFNFEVAKQVSQVSDAKVIYSPDIEKKYLVSQSTYGLMIEIGPVDHNTNQEKAISDCLLLTKEILKNVRQVDKDVHGKIKLYVERKDILYPKTQGTKLNPIFDRSDFKKYHNSCQAFLNESTNEMIQIDYEGEFFPIFIGEASYLENGLAFTVCEEIEIEY